MTAITRRRAGEALVPLSQRFYWTTALRLTIIVTPILIWAVDASHRSASWPYLTTPAAVYAAITAASLLTPRGGRGLIRAVVGIGCMLDGIWLAWALNVCGQLHGGVGYIVMLHIAGVTLLSSFRTGIKMAIWDALLALMMLSAQSNGLLGTAPSHTPVGVIVSYLGLLLVTALTITSFAAINERELRRRRYDADALRAFGVTLAQATDRDEVAIALCRFGCEELLAERAILAIDGDSTKDMAFQRPFIARWSTAEGGAADLPQRGCGFDPRVTGLIDTQEAHLLKVTERKSGWIGEQLPGATNVMLVPLRVEAAGRSVLVLDFSGPTLRRRSRLDRRAVGTAEQAATQAAMALDRAGLVERLSIEARRDALPGWPTGALRRRRSPGW